MTEEEWRRLLRNQQDQGTISARLQVELAGHLRDSAVTTQQFYDFVMHPEDGVVVRVSRLDGDLARLAARVEANGASAIRVPGLEVRVGALEQINKDAETARKDLKRWAWRDVLVPLLAAILAAVAASIITAAAVGHP